MKTTCPLCQTKIEDSAVYCEKCGYQLSIAPGIKGQFTTKGPAPTAGPQAFLETEQGQQLVLPAKAKINLGRNDPDSGVYPDLDLSSLDAEKAGVSRLHLQIQRDASGFFARDLESSNHSYLNGAQLEPLTNNRLVSGDTLQLGDLVLHFRLKGED